MQRRTLQSPTQNSRPANSVFRQNSSTNAASNQVASPRHQANAFSGVGPPQRDPPRGHRRPDPPPSISEKRPLGAEPGAHGEISIWTLAVMKILGINLE